MAERSVHSGHVVVAEIVAVGVAVAALSPVPLGWLLVPAAAGLAVVAFGRWRRRWLYQWLGVALRYAARQHTLSLDLELAADGVIEDEYGVSALLEVGDPASLLSDAPLALPAPASLLPPVSPDAPGVHVQFVVSGSPARTAGIPATSYRQLTEGRIAAYQRILLAVRVLRDDGGWTGEDLRRTLASTVRRVRRRLDQERIPHRPLTALPDLAVAPVRESWPGLFADGLRQACLRIGNLPVLRPELAEQVVSRLLAVPATAVTVSLAASRAGSDLVVRVAAPDPAGLATAVQGVRRLLGAVGLTVRRLDGEHLDGLLASLPLGRVLVPGPAGALGERASTLPGSGVMVGRNRRGSPVIARLVRPEPTRVLLVGGIRAAETLTLRALALGAHVLVQTGRPAAWEPFLRAVSLPSDTIAMVPPGQTVALPPAGRLAPQLVVVDVGTAAGDPPGGYGPWRTTMVVRDDLAAADVDPLARADLVILQPLRPDEAVLAGATLGLGDGQEWLTRIRADMVGLVNRRAVRFALLSPTPLEQQLVGPPERATVA
jgi:type VII secretion protein EccE